MALLLPPLARRQRRRAALDLAGERQRGPAHLGEAPARLDAHVDVDAARPRCLGPADETEVGQRGPHHAGDLAHLCPVDARHRIEVDAQFVRVVQVLGADGVRVQLEAGQVGHPDQRGGVARHDLVRGAPGWKRELDDLHPRGPRFGRALLVEGLAADAVGKAQQHVRTATGRAQRPVGDGDVVADEVELGVAGVGEEDLPRIRHRHLVSRDVYDLVFDRRRHRPTA